MKNVLHSPFSDKNFSAAKSTLDGALPFVLLLLTLLIVFQFAFPVTQKLQGWLSLANWGVILYFVVRLGVDYRLHEPGEAFWRNHWMDVLMVIPLFSFVQEARIAKVAEETIGLTAAGDELAATTALRNSQAAAKITRIARIIRRSV